MRKKWLVVGKMKSNTWGDLKNIVMKGVETKLKRKRMRNVGSHFKRNITWVTFISHSPFAHISQYHHFLTYNNNTFSLKTPISINQIYKTNKTKFSIYLKILWINNIPKKTIVNDFHVSAFHFKMYFKFLFILLHHFKVV